MLAIQSQEAFQFAKPPPQEVRALRSRWQRINERILSNCQMSCNMGSRQKPYTHSMRSWYVFKNTSSWQEISGHARTLLRQLA